MKVSDLTGAQLDYWVAKDQGLNARLDHYLGDGSNPVTKCIILERNISGYDNESTYRPSTDWAHGGPLIERERISVITDTRSGWAAMWPGRRCEALGPTPLVAAMRAYVASKFGEEVPDL